MAKKAHRRVLLENDNEVSPKKRARMARKAAKRKARKQRRKAKKAARKAKKAAKKRARRAKRANKKFRKAKSSVAIKKKDLKK